MAGEWWRGYEDAARKSPWKIFFKILILFVPIGLVLSGIGYTCGLFREGGKVVQEEFGPSALLTKYEWFKDSAAELEKKRADISVYRERVKSMEEDYGSTPRKDWDRTDKEQLSIWRSEVAGVIASYNGLAAEYNAQMAKFNWRFANVGELPKGADDPLPREFKAYETK